MIIFNDLIDDFCSSYYLTKSMSFPFSRHYFSCSGYG